MIVTFFAQAKFAIRLNSGTISIWSPMKKIKIGSFRTRNKEIKVTNEKGRIIVLKEERNLLQRFIIVSRKRSDLDLEECIGDYEFGVVPRALFDADGSMLLEKQKYKVASLLIDMGSDDEIVACTSSLSRSKVIIFDGMAVVNSLPKDKNDKIETCKDLADLFIQQLTLKSIGYDEIRLVFDRYISDSLKFKTRQGRTKSIQSIH